jgi:hypothetical protein
MKNKGAKKTPKKRAKKKNPPISGKRSKFTWVGPLIFAAIFGLLTAFTGLEGHWHKLWAKVLVVPGFLLAIAFGFGELLMYLRLSRVWSSVSAVTVLLVGAVVVGIYYPPLDRYREWLPPELPPNCKFVRISLGGFGNILPVEGGRLLRAEPFVRTQFGEMPFTAHVKDNRLYISTGTIIDASQRIIEIDVEKKLALPLDWDCNAKDNAFEIVNYAQAPVFQMFYQQPNEIVLKGLVANTNCVYVVDDHGASLWSPASNLPLPGIKRIFKYPSWRHSGEFAD